MLKLLGPSHELILHRIGSRKKQLLQPPGVHDLQFWLKPTQYCGIAWFLPQSNPIYGSEDKAHNNVMFSHNQISHTSFMATSMATPPSKKTQRVPPASSSPRSAALIPLEVASWGGGRPWRFNGLVSKSAGSRGNSGRFSQKKRYGSAHPHNCSHQNSWFLGIFISPFRWESHS